MKNQINQPSNAFVAASWVALVAGIVSYLIGLWNTKTMPLNEKGYYFTIIMYGLFSVVSVQKSVRDRLENLPVTPVYYALSWVSTILAIVLLIVGLYNADLELSQKGFFGMSFLMSLFAAIAVQKNTRDLQQKPNDEDFITNG